LPVETPGSQPAHIRPLQEDVGTARAASVRRAISSYYLVTMGLMSFTNMYFIEYNLLTAAAVISILPILLIFITLQRWVVQAVVMSGLKG
jgi:ABC-type glycerol-3-phosphate transport system permease component